MTLDVAVNVIAHAWDAIADLEPLTEKVVLQALMTSGVELADYCEVCVTYCDDTRIRELNAQWRGKDQATNVLSFPTPGALDDKPMLGDIVIAYETTAREAHERDKPVCDYVAYLIAHGFLHLIGYDHESRGEAEAMEDMERRIAAALGLDDPYFGTQPVDDPAALNEPSDSHADTN